MGDTWHRFLDRFPHLDKVHPQVRQLGFLLQERAEDLEKTVEDGAVTRVHGDPKGWNFFFGKSTATSPFLLIDLQWTGRGHPLQDVAYSLTTTLEEGALDQMDHLVDYYMDRLEQGLKARKINVDIKGIRNQYDKVWLDYTRVVVAGLWRRLNMEGVEVNKMKVGPSMITRSLPHIHFITQRLCRLLL